MTERGQPLVGEFDQTVLLTVLRLEERAYAPSISRELEQGGARRVSRGTLYSSLDRLEHSGHLEWQLESATARRAGNRRRRFALTQRGIRVLAAATGAGPLDLEEEELHDFLTKLSR